VRGRLALSGYRGPPHPLIRAFASNVALVSSFLPFKQRWIGAILTALLLAVLYVFWTHYPHGLVLTPATRPV
jgi:hypothetical protein